MTIELSKVGGKCKIVVNSGATALYVNLADVSLTYTATADTISVMAKVAGDYNSYKNLPIANVTMATVVVTNQTVFETQLALVFP